MGSGEGVGVGQGGQIETLGLEEGQAGPSIHSWFEQPNQKTLVELVYKRQPNLKSRNRQQTTEPAAIVKKEERHATFRGKDRESVSRGHTGNTNGHCCGQGR